jgi:hypothetical protein
MEKERETLWIAYLEADNKWTKINQQFYFQSGALTPSEKTAYSKATQEKIRAEELLLEYDRTH